MIMSPGPGIERCQRDSSAVKSKGEQLTTEQARSFIRIARQRQSWLRQKRQLRHCQVLPISSGGKSNSEHRESTDNRSVLCRYRLDLDFRPYAGYFDGRKDRICTICLNYFMCLLA